jgi:hypothetical protein
MNIEGIQLQAELPPKCINIYFLAIVSLAIILGIKHYIVELMENKIIKMFKDMVIRTTRIINNQENINYNSFSPLETDNVECHKCNNYGRKASDCRLPKHPIKTSKIQE